MFLFSYNIKKKILLQSITSAHTVYEAVLSMLLKAI